MSNIQGFTDTQRLNWVGSNRSANHDSDGGENWVATWVPQGALGNENGNDSGNDNSK